MSVFGDRLKALRKGEGMTQVALAKRLGLAFSTISMYEKGEREPDFETANAIADLFDVSMDYLHGKSERAREPLFTPQISEDYVTYPVIGEIAAGFESVALEEWTGDRVDIPVSYLKGHKREEFFVLCVKGDSMYPSFQNGDRVLILKQEVLDHSGQIAAVLYDDELATLKRIEYDREKGWMRLIPINPNVPPVEITGERLNHCRILGVPKVLIREFSA